MLLCNFFFVHIQCFSCPNPASFCFGATGRNSAFSLRRGKFGQFIRKTGRKPIQTQHRAQFIRKTRQEKTKHGTPAKTRPTQSCGMPNALISLQASLQIQGTF
jgi:hypothetical protein